MNITARLSALRCPIRKTSNGHVIIHDPLPLLFLIVECDDEAALIDAYGHVTNGGNPDPNDPDGRTHPLTAPLETAVLDQLDGKLVMNELLTIVFQDGHDVSLVCVETPRSAFVATYRPDRAPSFLSIASGPRDELLRLIINEYDVIFPFIDDSPWRSIAQVVLHSSTIPVETVIAAVQCMTGRSLSVEMIEVARPRKAATLTE